MSTLSHLRLRIQGQVLHLKARQISLREGLVSLPQHLGQLTDGWAVKQPIPSRFLQASSMSRVDSPRPYNPTASRSKTSLLPGGKLISNVLIW
jgi:hypothetical protein